MTPNLYVSADDWYRGHRRRLSGGRCGISADTRTVRPVASPLHRQMKESSLEPTPTCVDSFVAFEKRETS